jgi:alpha-galactosidase
MAYGRKSLSGPAGRQLQDNPNMKFFLTSLMLGAVSLAMLAVASGPVRAQTADDLKADAPPANAIWLSSLDLSKLIVGFGTPVADKSIDGNQISLGNVKYAHGVAAHAVSMFTVDLKGAATHFASMVGVDDEAKANGSVKFIVIVDGKRVAHTGVLHNTDAPQLISVDLTGAKTLVLKVDDGGDGIDNAHGDWAGAEITLAANATDKPVAVASVNPVDTSPGRLVMPVPDPVPAIHGARVVGATPGRPFLYMIAATGDAPLTYSAKRLPAGLSIDPATGIITGSLASAGTTVVTITVKGPKGVATRNLTIVGGDHKLALTPPMGWNSWNVWAGHVDEGKVRAAADSMVASGLAAHGFNYVNIDDTWEAGRDANGNITTNDKFPDMKALCDYVHSKGLKIGIYSSPGPKTCAGFTASYQHEDQDAASYAQWGFDYLKYDWCSYQGVSGPKDAPDYFQKPYVIMRKSLDKVNRDILFSYCQYGMGDPWKWGPADGGNCWRTTGDINDSWGSLHGILERQNGLSAYAGPGHWNDPDMLIVGVLGWGTTHPSRLTQNEQILHISMWCMLSAPLLIGCDMTKLDPFTYAVLSNDELLDINQDPLGKPAERITQSNDADVWARTLFDGTKAVALVNTGDEAQPVTVNWSDIGVKGAQPVRDLWMHKDMGAHDSSYTDTVPSHGCIVLKIGRPKAK